jgi:hypothetical protein
MKTSRANGRISTGFSSIYTGNKPGPNQNNGDYQKQKKKVKYVY